MAITIPKMRLNNPLGEVGSKDLVQFVYSFKTDVGETQIGSHPATLALDTLGSGSDDSNKLHAAQLDGWYNEYACKVRKMPYLYRPPALVT